MDSQPISVLLVEDNRVEAHRIQQMLAAAPALRCAVVHAATLADAIRRLQEQAFHIVLLDLILPDSQDLGTLRRMLEYAKEIPIVILSNLADGNLATQAVHEGAQDYVLKGHLHPDLLARSIRQAIERQDLLLQLRESERQYRRSVDAAPDPIWLLDHAGHIRYVNQQFCRVLQREASETVGRPWVELVAPASQERSTTLTFAVEQSGTGYEMVQLVRRDGQAVPMELHAVELGRDRIQVIGRDMSDWLRVQEALRTSETRLARILDSAMDAIITIDADQRIVLFNRAAEQMFRCPAAEAVGHAIDRFIPARSRGAHAQHLAAYAETGRSNRAMGALATLSALRADGEEFPMEATLSQVTVGDRRLFTVIMRDVSDRIRAQGALQESEERYLALTEGSFDLICEAGVDARYTYVSPNHRSVLGYEPSELLGTNIFAQVHPDDLPAVLTAFEEGMRTRRSGRAEFRSRHKEGSWRWLESTGSPYVAHSGELRALLISRDITAIKDTEATLRHSQQFLQSAIDALTNSVAILDETGCIAAVNAAWRKGIARLSAGEAEWGMGANLLQTLSGATGSDAEHLLRLAHGIGEVLAGEQDVCTIEYPWHSADEMHWLKSRVTRFLEAGRPRIVVTTTVITRRKTLGGELRQSEERYRRLLDRAPDALWIVDHTLRYLYLNDAACRLLGRPREAVVGHHLAEFRPAGELATLETAFQRVRRDGTVDFVSHLLRGDGSDIAVEIHAVDIGNGQYEAVVRDISAWVSEEAARAASAERYRQALDRATEGICLVDTNGRFTYVNETAGALLLRDRDQLLGRQVAEVVPEEERPALRRALAPGQENDGALVALRFQCGDGSLITLELDALALENGGRQLFLREAGVRDRAA